MLFFISTGRVHHIPLCPPGGGTVLVTVHLVSENQTVQGLAMRWMRMEKLIRKKFSCSTIDHLCKEIIPILNFFESSQIGLDSGLYLCYLRLQSTVNTIHVLVPENAPSVLPFSAIRTNPHVSAEEWEYLRQMENTCSSSCEDDSPLLPSTPSREISAAPQFPPSIPTPVQLQFHQQISKAARTLVTDLGLDIDAVRHHRLFRLQVSVDSFFSSEMLLLLGGQIRSRCFFYSYNAKSGGCL